MKGFFSALHRTLTITYGWCDEYSDDRSKQRVGMREDDPTKIRAITFAAVTPCGGADCENPYYISWYFWPEEGQPDGNRENASPLFEKE